MEQSPEGYILSCLIVVTLESEAGNFLGSF